MRTSTIRCASCGQVNTYTDNRGGCPACGAPLADMNVADMNIAEMLPYIDLARGTSVIRELLHRPLQIYEVDILVPSAGSYWYDVPEMGVLHAVTFICPLWIKAHDLKYIITVDGTRRILEVTNIAWVTDAPVGVDTRRIHNLQVEIENRSQSEARMKLVFKQEIGGRL